MKLLLAVLLGSILFQSCVQSKYLVKNNKLFKVEPTDQTLEHFNIVTYDVDVPGKIRITESNGFITVTPVKDSKLKLSSPTIVAKDVDPKKYFANLNNFYFPEHSLDSLKINSVKYIDTKPVLQTIAIPVKIRPALPGALKDTFPSTTESGINFGIAGGWKFSKNYFKESPNIFGQTTDRYSFSVAVPLAFTSASLDKTNTRDPIIAVPRKALIVSTGLLFTLGIDNINFGGMLGTDLPTGPSSSTYLYRHKLWYGIVFSIDLVK